MRENIEVGILGERLNFVPAQIRPTYPIACDDPEACLKTKPITENEKCVFTWKKQTDGKWKVIADIWNTDK